MESYENLGGGSGVDAYAIGPDSITVRFRSGATYVYTHASAGAANVGRMQSLARQGEGLNSYINTRAKYLYARKLR